MGVVICAVHGRSGGKLVCRDISAALREQAPLPERVVAIFGDPTTPHIQMTFCATCVTAHAIPTIPARIDEMGDEVAERILDLPDLVCSKCFVDAERELSASSR